MNCETCGRMNIPAVGPRDADILFIAHAPTAYDVKDLTPWTGPVGKILRLELRRAGINYNDCRVTNVWRHVPTAECGIEYHLDAALNEMEERKFVILLGADTVKYFTGENVSDVSGLRVDKIGITSEMLPPSVGMAFALFSPALAAVDLLGELSHGLGKIAGVIKDGN